MCKISKEDDCAIWTTLDFTSSKTMTDLELLVSVHALFSRDGAPTAKKARMATLLKIVLHGFD